MVVLDNDGFLSALTKFFQSSRTSGSIFLTMKKYNGRTKPMPKPRKGKTPAAGDHVDENLCLVRASNGKKKISTIISSREVTKFQMAYGNLLKAHMDGLKKRDKRGSTKPIDNSSSKKKKSKTTNL